MLRNLKLVLREQRTAVGDEELGIREAHVPLDIGARLSGILERAGHRLQAAARRNPCGQTRGGPPAKDEPPGEWISRVGCNLKDRLLVRVRPARWMRLDQVFRIEFEALKRLWCHEG